MKRRTPRIFAALALALSAALLASCGGGGSVQSMAFGTGGTLCDLPTVASTFPSGSDVRMTAHFSPAPTKVTATLSKDGAELGSSSVDFSGDNNCAAFDLGALPVGHYAMTVTTVPASGMPALTGAFDVTP